MASIEEKRHTLAHLLAAAVLERYPHAKAAIGPAIENGFYYDFDFSGGTTPGEADLQGLENAMREMLPSWESMHGTGVSEKDARDRFTDNLYKLELIGEIAAKGESITLYTADSFTDLCRGGHCENPAKDLKPDAFALDRIAGAYWRGDEKNAMLTRIYGLAFDSKEELDVYRAQQEEAKKRDHRKLGKELDLFTISELVGGGLPLFTPKGAVLRETLASYSQELQAEYGFKRVWTPHMARTELYKHSGHFDKYPERFEVTSAESSDTFMLKPMNCPHHAQLFARKPWSYRELPVRYMENTTNYRDEKHGELHGLSRVRSLSQDDGHVFCQEEHIEKEVGNIVKMTQRLYSALGLDYYVRLSFRDGDSDKFLGDDDLWQRAEATLEKVADREGLATVPGPGEAAFYGPKFDFMVKDALGREWQCATIQVDFVQPERFGLTYIDSDGKEKRPVMIHKALLGSIERFISVYIEHTAGNFPVWLSPEQARILPISDKHNSYAEEVRTMLDTVNVRVEVDDSSETLGKKIRNAKQEKIPYLLVVGDAEVTDGTVSVESRDEGKLDAMKVTAFVKRITEEVLGRK